MTLDLTAVRARIHDCSTYNFGMRNADKLAKEDAPALVERVEELERLVSFLQGAGKPPSRGFLLRLRERQLGNALGKVEELQGIVDRVREEHPVKRSHRFIWGLMEDQWDPSKEPVGEEVTEICRNCLTQYPCATIRALDAS